MRLLDWKVGSAVSGFLVRNILCAVREHPLICAQCALGWWLLIDGAAYEGSRWSAPAWYIYIPAVFLTVMVPLYVHQTSHCKMETAFKNFFKRRAWKASNDPFELSKDGSDEARTIC